MHNLPRPQTHLQDSHVDGVRVAEGNHRAGRLRLIRKVDAAVGAQRYELVYHGPGKVEELASDLGR